MPLLIGELINNLALKAGIDPADEGLKSLLTSPELATVKVPDELVQSIDKGLLSIEAAKNNHPDIKRKYFADAWDGMDKQLISLIESDTFDQADLDEIKAERSTTKKAELIVTKLKAAKSSAKGIDKEEVNRQLAAANETARLAKIEAANEKAAGEQKLKGLELKYAKRGVFSNYKTIYDELDGGIKLATIEAILDKALQDKNAKLEADENGNLVLVGNDGTNVFGSNNVQLTAKSFLDQTLAPILKVSGPPQPVAPQRQSTAVVTTAADANTGNIKSFNDQVLANMATAKPSMI